MRVFVTGGNGFVGSVVVRTLLSEGYDVRCLLRATSNTERIDGLGYERVDGDVRDIDSIRAGMTGCDAAIHLASLSSWDSIDSPEMEQVVIAGTQNVLDVAGDIGGVRVVYVSSVAAIDGTSTPSVVDESAPYSLEGKRGLTYAHYKHRAEKLCQAAVAAGTPVIIVNPAEVYGPNDTDLITAGNLIDFATSNPVVIPRGGTSVVHVEDVAMGIVRAMERGAIGERYILGGDNLRLDELAALTLDLLGKQSKLWALPNGLIRAVTAVASTLHIPLPYNPKVIPYATRYWFVDNSKAKRELGVSFRSARETLQPAVQWLRDEGHVS